MFLEIRVHANFSSSLVSTPGTANAEAEHYFLVTAPEGSTEVTVTLPSGVTASTGTTSRTGPSPFSTTLSSGDQILTVTSGDDLTGTLVASDKRIGVIAGAQMMKSHENCSTSAHALEQMTPVETWGTNHVIRALGDGMINPVRIISESLFISLSNCYRLL